MRETISPDSHRGECENEQPQLRLLLMHFDVVFTRFFCVMASVKVMPMCEVCMMCGCFRTAGLMMACGFAVMTCGMFVVLGSFRMMVNSCVGAHTRPSFLLIKIMAA